MDTTTSQHPVNKDFKSKDLSSRVETSTSLNVRSFLSLWINPHKAESNCFQSRFQVVCYYGHVSVAKHLAWMIWKCYTVSFWYINLDIIVSQEKINLENFTCISCPSLGHAYWNCNLKWFVLNVFHCVVCRQRKYIELESYVGWKI